MKIDRIWKIIGCISLAVIILFTIINVRWNARHLGAEILWELTAQIIYPASLIIPFAVGIFIGSKIKNTLLAWIVGIALFFTTGLAFYALIDKAPRQLKWRIEAMREYQPDYDGSRP